jgi:putative oxidoreductase
MNALFDRYRDHGLLLLRVGLGAMFLWHGLPKLLGGPELWAMVGSALGNFGITFAPAFWGLLAALAEAGGGLLLILGLAVRPAALSMFGTMIVAATMHLANGEGLKGASHAIEVGIVFAALVFIGAGRFSLDARRAESVLVPARA